MDPLYTTQLNSTYKILNQRTLQSFLSFKFGLHLSYTFNYNMKKKSVLFNLSKPTVILSYLGEGGNQDS